MTYIDIQLRDVRRAVSTSDPDILWDAISALLENPNFCPDGGLLAFPLYLSYPVNRRTPEYLDDVLDWLEDEDEVVASVCYTYGLDVTIKAVLEEEVSGDFRQPAWEGSRLLIDRVPYMDGHLIGDYYLTEHFLQTEPYRDVIHPYDGWPCYGNGYLEYSKAIAWVGMSWLGEGGRRKNHSVYMHLIVSFGPAGDRTNWEAYEGELTVFSKTEQARTLWRKDTDILLVTSKKNIRSIPSVRSEGNMLYCLVEHEQRTHPLWSLEFSCRHSAYPLKYMNGIDSPAAFTSADRGPSIYDAGKAKTAPQSKKRRFKYLHSVNAQNSLIGKVIEGEIGRAPLKSIKLFYFHFHVTPSGTYLHEEKTRARKTKTIARNSKA
ncbi:hypothetical protein L218DRAFT_950757 [Marasmius fiardii PR-910]|nr:hypothetical protein L218DRAFT_950757 [Marasmius fiardii PR-910]